MHLRIYAFTHICHKLSQTRFTCFFAWKVFVKKSVIWKVFVFSAPPQVWLNIGAIFSIPRILFESMAAMFLYLMTLFRILGNQKLFKGAIQGMRGCLQIKINTLFCLAIYISMLFICMKLFRMWVGSFDRMKALFCHQSILSVSSVSDFAAEWHFSGYWNVHSTFTQESSVLSTLCTH